MRFRIILILSGLFFLHYAFAQPLTHKSQKKSADQAVYNALMFSFDYASNTNVLGNFNTETRQQSLSPSMVFLSRWNVDFSAIGNFIGNSDDSLENFTSELDFILGYTLEPFENLTIYPSYAHYFYSSNSNSLKSIFSDDIRLDMDYNYKFVNLGVSAGYFIGKQHTFYAEVHNYYRVTIDRFLFSKGYLSLQPGIDANFGSYQYLNLYYLDELKENPLLYFSLRRYPAIKRYVYYEMIKHPGLTYKEALDNYLEEKARDNFKLTSLGINLPITYNIGNIGINIGLFAFIPTQQPDYLSEDVQFFIDLGLSYSFIFK